MNIAQSIASDHAVHNAEVIDQTIQILLDMNIDNSNSSTNSIFMKGPKSDTGEAGPIGPSYFTEDKDNNTITYNGLISSQNGFIGGSNSVGTFGNIPLTNLTIDPVLNNNILTIDFKNMSFATVMVQMTSNISSLNLSNAVNGSQYYVYISNLTNGVYTIYDKLGLNIYTNFTSSLALNPSQLAMLQITYSNLQTSRSNGTYFVTGFVYTT